MSTEATALLTALGGTGMCVEEAKAYWIIFHLEQSQEIPFCHTVNAVVYLRWRCTYWLGINF